MPKLSDLVESVATVEGMDPATVALIARNVREAGLIRTGGRGPSAGKMAVTDAVNLLIAVNAADKVGESAKTVKTFRRLETYGRFTGRTFKLGDVLEQLIQAASNKALPEQFVFDRVPPRVAEAFSQETARVAVSFGRPVPLVRIAIATSDSVSVWFGETGSIKGKYFREADSIGYEFGWPYSEDAHPPKHFGDRRDVTTIEYATIRAVGKLFPSKDALGNSRSRSLLSGTTS